MSSKILTIVTVPIKLKKVSSVDGISWAVMGMGVGGNNVFFKAVSWVSGWGGKRVSLFFRSFQFFHDERGFLHNRQGFRVSDCDVPSVNDFEQESDHVQRATEEFAFVVDAKSECCEQFVDCGFLGARIHNALADCDTKRRRDSRDVAQFSCALFGGVVKGHTNFDNVRHTRVCEAVEKPYSGRHSAIEGCDWCGSWITASGTNPNVASPAYNTYRNPSLSAY